MPIRKSDGHFHLHIIANAFLKLRRKAPLDGHYGSHTLWLTEKLLEVRHRGSLGRYSLLSSKNHGFCEKWMYYPYQKFRLSPCHAQPYHCRLISTFCTPNCHCEPVRTLVWQSTPINSGTDLSILGSCSPPVYSSVFCSNL